MASFQKAADTTFTYNFVLPYDISNALTSATFSLVHKFGNTVETLPASGVIADGVSQLSYTAVNGFADVGSHEIQGVVDNGAKFVNRTPIEKIRINRTL